jgi:hypothetical protein
MWNGQQTISNNYSSSRKDPSLSAHYTRELQYLALFDEECRQLSHMFYLLFIHTSPEEMRDYVASQLNSDRLAMARTITQSVSSGDRTHLRSFLSWRTQKKEVPHFGWQVEVKK